MVQRMVLGAVLFLHGLIHLLGSIAYWRLAEVEGLPYETALLAGALEVGEAGAWIYGLAWLVAAVGFSVSAAAVLLGEPWWPGAAAGTALLSLGLTILGLPGAWFGVLVNLAILAYVAVGRRRGRVPHEAA